MISPFLGWRSCVEAHGLQFRAASPLLAHPYYPRAAAHMHRVVVVVPVQPLYPVQFNIVIM